MRAVEPDRLDAGGADLIGHAVMGGQDVGDVCRRVAVVEQGARAGAGATALVGIQEHGGRAAQPVQFRVARHVDLAVGGARRLIGPGEGPPKEVRDAGQCDPDPVRVDPGGQADLQRDAVPRGQGHPDGLGLLMGDAGRRGCAGCSR